MQSVEPREAGGVAAVMPNWLGDFVMSAGAFAALARARAPERIAALVPRPFAALARAALPAGEVVGFSLGTGLTRLRGRARLAAFMRARAYRAAAIFPNSFGSALAVRLAGTRVRAGTAAHGRSILLTHVVAPAGADEHEADVFARVARASLADDDAATGRFEVRASDASMAVPGTLRDGARALLSREGLDAERESFLAIAPGAAYGPAKRYGAGNFAEVAREAAARGLRPVLVGGAADAGAAAEVAAGIERLRPVDLTGRTDVPELAGVLALAAGFAGNDSGAAHVAAALGTPTAVLFLSTDPARTGQRGPRVRLLIAPVECRPCLRRICPRGEHVCRDAVRPREVTDALGELGAFERRR